MLKLITIIKPYSAFILAAWVIAIITMSSIPDIPTLKLHAAKKDIRLDYLIHFCEYGFLAFMAYLAFSGRDFNPGAGRLILITAGLVLFAVADEMHQKFIPGRSYNPRDTVSNLLGITVALISCLIIFRMIRKRYSTNE